MIFAYDKNVALYGYLKRYEGLYSILYYLSMALLSSFVTEKYKKYIINFILICGAFHACYAVCQIYELLGVKTYTHTYLYLDENTHKIIRDVKIWAVGCTTNPNVFGAYMMICLSYAIGMFLSAKKIFVKIIYAFAMALFSFGIMISNCGACVVGVACVLLFVLVYSIKKKFFKQLLIILFIMVSIVTLAVRLDKTRLLGDVKDTANQTTEIAKGNVQKSYGTKRVFIWSETIIIVPKYLLHGIGIDNFYYAFDGQPLRYKNYVYDKAHNEYLQILVTQGIFAVLSYIALYGYVLFVGIKNSFKLNKIYLVLPIIGYVAQAFFSISVIELAPIFFVAIGLCAEGHKRL